MTRNSLLAALLQTVMITAGGFLLVRLMSHASGMSDGQLLMGPASVALLWLGMKGRPKAA